MSRDYLLEWATQLFARYPAIGALRDLATLNGAELSAVIAFIESYRALEAITR